MEPKLLKVSEVATRLAVTPATVRNYIRDGHLRATRVAKGKTWRIAEDELKKVSKPERAQNVATQETG